jgi:glutathione peroxidase
VPWKDVRGPCTNSGARGRSDTPYRVDQDVDLLGGVVEGLSSSEAIKEFCSTTYGVTFPMFEKIRVNGRSQHPLYAELTKAADAEGKAGKVKWNFEKFVVTPAGEVHRFRPKVEPDAPEIVDLMEAALRAATSKDR